MFGINFHSVVRRRCHQALVWAMVPLAVLNGRTVVSCGCSGRVLAECHCGRSAFGQKAAHHNGAVCPKCTSARAAETEICCGEPHSATNEDPPRSIGGHHCRSIANYEVIPVTTVPSPVDEQVASLDLIADFPATAGDIQWSWTSFAIACEPHPPHDLLHPLSQPLTPRLLPLPRVLGTPETHLAHRVLRLSESQYLTTTNRPCSDFP